MKIQLRSHQQTALNRFCKSGGICLQWSTGMGKGYFISSILTPGDLVICPPHLVDDWVLKIRETQPELEHSIHILSKKTNCFIYGSMVNIVSLPTLHRNIDEVMKLTRQCDGFRGIMVIDEAHMIKNYKGAWYRSVRRLRGLFRRYIAASATFQTRTDLDLFTNAFLSDPGLLEAFKWSFWNFANNHVNFERKWIGSRTIETPTTLKAESKSELIIPRYHYADYDTADDVEKPIRVHKQIKLECTRALAKCYDSFFDELQVDATTRVELIEADMIKRNGIAFRFNQLANSMTYLDPSDMHTCGLDAKAKGFGYKEKLDAVKSIMETHSEQKGLILYQYTFERNQLVKALGKKVAFWQGVNNIEAFESENCTAQVMVASYQQIGVGVRFKKTDFCIAFSTPMNLGNLLQGWGRLEYVGRPNPFNTYDFRVDHKTSNDLLDALRVKFNARLRSHLEMKNQEVTENE